MNKSIGIIVMAAMMLLSVSCKKQEGTNKVRLEASIESPSGKAYTTLTSPTSVWEEKDEIYVNGNKMHLESMNEDHDKGLFACDNWIGQLPSETTPLYAIYPAIDQKPKANGDGWKSYVSVPSHQDYIDPKPNKMRVPMGISSVSEKLEFHNLVNLYGVPVYTESGNDLVVTKVVMEKALSPVDEYNVGEFIDNLQIAANIWYPHYGSETADIEIIDDESYTIELNCKVDGFENGVEISKDPANPTFFYFIAWPVQLGKGLILKFYDEDGLICSKVKPIKSKIEYNRIYELRDASSDGNDRKPFLIKRS